MSHNVITEPSHVLAGGLVRRAGIVMARVDG
jgi:hypothetical protein